MAISRLEHSKVPRSARSPSPSGAALAEASPPSSASRPPGAPGSTPPGGRGPLSSFPNYRSQGASRTPAPSLSSSLPPCVSSFLALVLAGSAPAELEKVWAETAACPNVGRGGGKEEGAGRPGEGGIGAGGRAAQNLPRARGWGRRRGRSARGLDGGLGPRSRAAESLVPSPPSALSLPQRRRARTHPPAGPLPCPATPSRRLPPWPWTSPAPAVQGTLAASPFLPAARAPRGSDPPSREEGEGEDRAGRTETESGRVGVGTAQGHCVCVCV